MTILVATGKLAREFCGMRLPLQILQSNAGFYIGTASEDLGPVSRESDEYWPTHEDAQKALDARSWTQRHEP